MNDSSYDVVIIGGGASGTALLYALARYTRIGRVALVEKEAALGAVNSNAKNNSQTLHVGDIETNYSIDKVRQVQPAAMMVKHYTDALPASERSEIIHPVQKLVIGVGAKNVNFLRERFSALKELFPDISFLENSAIAAVEPAVMVGRAPHEQIAGIFNPEGYAVNFGKLAASFAARAQAERAGVEVLLSTRVASIERAETGYLLHTNKGAIRARALVVDADAYSLKFAKSLGYGTEYSLIPIAGSFYFSPPVLRGKVYQVQDPRMPFAAVHGDPDLTRAESTRWGPTARFYPVLEARRPSTTFDFFAASGVGRIATWISFVTILLEPVRLWYLIRNFFYDLPIVGKIFFLPLVRTIVPSMKLRDLTYAHGYGGMRLQRVDTRTRQLLLGEGKIVGEKVIFNMTPSPGASVSLYNAMRDAETIASWDPGFSFDKERMLKELSPLRIAPEGDISLRESYAS